jgi:branched-chain amino acid aminotransferase
MSYINHNGELVYVKTPIFTAYNRAFCYGDALFETIRIYKGKPLFINDHFSRLSKGMDILKMELSEKFTTDFLYEKVAELALKNQLAEGGRARVEVYRNEGGFYISSTNKASYVITGEKTEKSNYQLNNKGLLIDIFKDAFKLVDILSPLKTTNKLPFVLAGFFKSEKNLDEAFVLNNHGRVCETINANVFLYKNDQFYTPAIEEGCIEGVMRRNIIKILQENGKTVHETKISPEELILAEEIFLTNSIAGIIWVGGYKEKRFFNHISKWLVELLNKKVEEQSNS